MPLTFVFLLMTAMMRGVGDTVTPLLALAFRPSSGWSVTPVLIRGWFGLPAARRGQRGRGVGGFQRADAVRAGSISCCARRRASAGFGRRISARAAARSCALLGENAAASAFRRAVGMVVMAIAELVLLGLVNGFGSDATAAYGAVNQIIGYVQFSGDIDCDIGLDLRRAGDRRRQAGPGRHASSGPALRSISS